MIDHEGTYHNQIAFPRKCRKQYLGSAIASPNSRILLQELEMGEEVSTQRSTVPILQLTKLSLVPAGDLREEAGHPGDTLYIGRMTVWAGIAEAPAGPAACEARGEFGAEGNLCVLGVLEGLLYEGRYALCWWFRLP